MVQEVRKIILSPDELISAYESYRRMTPGFMPEGKIIDCILNVNGSVMVQIEPLQGNAFPRIEHVVDAVDTLRPLIRFCLENNIMLPRNGRKSVSVIRGTSSPCISLNIDIDLGDLYMAMCPSRPSELTEVYPKEEHNQTVEKHGQVIAMV